MSKTLIIFDIDGTLLYSNRVDSRCFAEAYQQLYNKPFPTIDWRQYPAVSDTVIFETVINAHFNRVPTEKEVAIFQEIFVSLIQQKRVEQPDEFKEVPGAVNAINRLREDNRFELGIATGGWRAPAMVKLSHIAISTTGVAAAFADGHYSRSSIIEESISKAKSNPGVIGRVVYVGDATWDVSTTREMQIPFVGIRMKGDFEVLSQAGAQTILQNYSNFENFLFAVENAVIPPVICES